MDNTDYGFDQFVSDKISLAIDQVGIKKTMLADKTGMPYSTLNSKLRGYSAFTIGEAYKIAHVLHVNPVTFFPEFSSAGTVV